MVFVCALNHAEVEGYAGQNLIECSSKRDLELAIGTSDGRDDEDEWEALFEAHKLIGEKYGSEVSLPSLHVYSFVCKGPAGVCRLDTVPSCHVD